MALLPDRSIEATNIGFYMNEVAERGGIVCYSTLPSGTSMDSSTALVTYRASVSGQRPMGLLLNDMVNINQTRQHINWHKDEVQIGGKVSIMRRGSVVTDMISGPVTAVGPAYLTHSGLLIAAPHTLGGVAATPFVGEFESRKDENGFARVYINLPMTNATLLS